uniref:Zinc ribbon domain-containing protein n=1 Tax=Streptomyces sp. NBC_00049 TaxID=2903617 RepID=A0AAU2JQC9_9ACTN
MDYCHACRRHLNGALACAGCGTPAEYLVPVAPAASAASATPGSGAPAALADVFADSLVTLSVPNERRPGARRRAAGRRRRRTTLTVALGVLIATAASLAAVRMVADAERTDRAATVVLTDDGPQQPAPLPDLPTSGAPAGPSGKATAKVAAGAAKNAGPGASAEPGTQPDPASSAPAPATSGPVSGTPGPGRTVKASGSATPKPSTSASGTASVPPPAPPTPSPTPKPTKSCVLWIFCS